MHPILIIDDEKDNLEALKRLLRGLYQVTTTTSPFEALKLLQKQTFNVIVSDQRMPEMPGVELLEKAKQIAPAATRILLTGYTDIESVINAINRGNIYRYIAKPWDPEDLRLTLKQANEASLLRQELDKKNQELAANNTELRSALEKLKGLDEAKAKFLSLVSHELNTPLTVLNAFAALLVERQGQLPEDLKKAVSGISGASTRFTDIVGEILAYVRLQADTRLLRTAFDFKKECEALGAVAAGTGNTVRNVDAEKMRSALGRLVKELSRGLPKGEKIKAELTERNGKLECRLSRAGDPLAVDALDALAPEGNILNHQKNLGLGFAMCRLILHAHGGSLSVENPKNGGAGLVLTI